MAPRPSRPRAPRPLPLTAEGHALLAERARDLRERRLPELRPLLWERDRDERDVLDFARAQAELDRLERVLAEAEVIDPGLADRRDVPAGQVRIGARIVIETPDLHRESVRIVHPVEASLEDDWIAVTSPLAQAVLGAKVGDTVWVPAPIGAWPCRIVDVIVERDEVLEGASAR